MNQNELSMPDDKIHEWKDAAYYKDTGGEIAVRVAVCDKSFEGIKTSIDIEIINCTKCLEVLLREGEDLISIIKERLKKLDK